MFTKPKTEVKNTMSREEYEKTLKSLQDQIEELKKVEIKDDKPKKGEIWQPNKKEQEYYYYIDCLGTQKTFRANCDNDNIRMLNGNFYKTKQEAEYQANVQRYTNLFRKYVEEHSEPLDWSDVSQEKYYIAYDYMKSKPEIEFGSFVSWKLQGVIWASSKAILDDAIEFVGKNNVIKYVLGVDND